MPNAIMQATIVAQTAPKPSQELVQLSLFGSDGTARVVSKQVAVQADTTAADLAALKVDFNALLAKLKTAGVMASS